MCLRDAIRREIERHNGVLRKRDRSMITSEKEGSMAIGRDSESGRCGLREMEIANSLCTVNQRKEERRKGEGFFRVGVDHDPFPVREGILVSYENIFYEILFPLIDIKKII